MPVPSRTAAAHCKRKNSDCSSTGPARSLSLWCRRFKMHPVLPSSVLPCSRRRTCLIRESLPVVVSADLSEDVRDGNRGSLGTSPRCALAILRMPCPAFLTRCSSPRFCRGFHYRGSSLPGKGARAVTTQTCNSCLCCSTPSLQRAFHPTETVAKELHEGYSRTQKARQDFIHTGTWSTTEWSKDQFPTLRVCQLLNCPIPTRPRAGSP